MVANGHEIVYNETNMVECHKFWSGECIRETFA